MTVGMRGSVSPGPAARQTPPPTPEAASREREVAEEPLPRADEPAEALALLLATELELRRVVHDQHAVVLACAASTLPEVRRKDRLRRHPVIAEEPVCGLELRVVECLRKSRFRPLRDQVRENGKPPIQPLVAQFGIAELLGQ